MSKCPIDHSKLQQVPAKCPFDHSKLKQVQKEQQCPYMQNDDNAETPAFNPQTDFSCPKCKTYIFDCTTCEPCKHSFCAACFSNPTQCPTCQQACDSKADKYKQFIITSYTETQWAHSYAHDAKLSNPFVALQCKALLEEDKITDEKTIIRHTDALCSLAMYYLHLSLKSQVGGNLQAALGRAQYGTEMLQQIWNDYVETSQNVKCKAQVLHVLGVLFGKMADYASANACEYFEKSLLYLRQKLSPEVKQNMNSITK